MCTCAWVGNSNCRSIYQKKAVLGRENLENSHNFKLLTRQDRGLWNTRREEDQTSRNPQNNKNIKHTIKKAQWVSQKLKAEVEAVSTAAIWAWINQRFALFALLCVCVTLYFPFPFFVFFSVTSLSVCDAQTKSRRTAQTKYFKRAQRKEYAKKCAPSALSLCLLSVSPCVLSPSAFSLSCVLSRYALSLSLCSVLCSLSICLSLLFLPALSVLSLSLCHHSTLCDFCLISALSALSALSVFVSSLLCDFFFFEIRQKWES